MRLNDLLTATESDEEFGDNNEEIEPADIAKELVKHYKLKAIRENDHPIYRYIDEGENEGIWVRAEIWLAEIVKRHYRYTSRREFEEILFSIWTMESVGVERGQFDSDPWMLHFNNGWYNLKTRKFEPHNANSHNMLSMSKSKVDYNPDAKCPATDTVLDMTLSKANKDLYLKVTGYCFLPTYAFKKAFVFLGPPDSLKTTLKEHIGNLVGWNNVSAVAWNDFDKPYMSADLYGKMVNLSSEFSRNNLLDTRVFKQLTGDDSITARKIRESPITFKNRAKLITAVNDMPEFKGVDEAIVKRIIVIDFDRQFREGEVPNELLEKMKSPDELSGLLNLALNALHQVMDDNGFNELDLEEKIAEYNERTSQLHDFVQDRCDIEPLANVPSKQLIGAYNGYCREKGIRPLSDGRFGEELLAVYENKGVIKDRQRIKGKPTYFYRGIKLKE